MCVAEQTRGTLGMNHRPVVVLALACLCTLSAQARDDRKPKVSYSYPDGEIVEGPVMPCELAGGNSVRLMGVCVAFGGMIGPGDFFCHLKRKNAGTGAVFRVGRRVVANFPDEVFVVITASTPATCSKDEVGVATYSGLASGSLPSGLPVDRLQTPHAEAGYIRGLQLKPLEATLTREGVGIPNHTWWYRFRIKTEGLRLTDALVLILISKDGEKLVQLSYRP